MKIDDVSTWSVLIVDDEPDNIDIVQICLEFHDAVVRAANDAAEAMAVLQDFQPNLILLDLTMPGIDGWELRETLNSDARTKDSPMIALTAHAMAGDRERALAVGFDGYISKPVEVLTFVDTVRAILAARDVSVGPADENMPEPKGQVTSEVTVDRSTEHDAV